MANDPNGWMYFIAYAIFFFEVGSLLDYVLLAEWPATVFYLTAGMFAGTTLFGQSVVATTTDMAAQIDPVVTLTTKVGVGLSTAVVVGLLVLFIWVDRKVKDSRFGSYERTIGIGFVLVGAFFAAVPYAVDYLAAIRQLMQWAQLDGLFAYLPKHPGTFKSLIVIWLGTLVILSWNRHYPMSGRFDKRKRKRDGKDQARRAAMV